MLPPSPLLKTWDSMDKDQRETLVRRTIDILLEKMSVAYPLTPIQYECRNFQTLAKIMNQVYIRTVELKEHTIENQLIIIQDFFLPTLIERHDRGVFRQDQRCLDALKTLLASVSKRRWKSGSLESFWAFSGENGLSIMKRQIEQLVQSMENVIETNKGIRDYMNNFDMSDLLSCIEDSKEVRL